MKILYIAYSCSPNYGSEDKIGWNIPLASTEDNQVWVITKQEHKAEIGKYLDEHPISNIQFYYADIPSVYKRVFRGALYSGRLNIWNKRALKIAKQLCAQEKIDVIHQITPVEFRSIGDYGKIPNVKFVCGPVAGGQMVPRGLKPYLKLNAATEMLRTVMNRWSWLGYKHTGKMKHCDHILFANRETENYLKPILPAGLEYDVISDVSIAGQDIQQHNAHADKPERKLRFLVVGRLVYLKGHAFLLDVLAQIPKEFDYECRIIGAGSEKKRLQKKCREMGLSQNVFFDGKVPYAQMGKVYQEADVLVMPSFREATGSVLLEAMANGLPVITINRFGGATMLDENTGWLYDGETKEELSESLLNAIMECIQNPEEVCRRGKNAVQTAQEYTWDERIKLYQGIYNKVVAG